MSTVRPASPDLAAQLHALQLASASSSSSSSSTQTTFAASSSSSASQSVPTSVDVVAATRARQAQEAAAQDEATVALYQELREPTPFTKKFGPRLDMYASPPPGMLDKRPAMFPLLKGASTAEQAVEARKRLSQLNGNDLRDIPAINLSNRGLTCVPKELSLFSSVVLDLSGNRLSSFPTDLPKMVMKLDLSRNQIVSSEVPMEVPPSVSSLNLSHNQLTTFPRMNWTPTNSAPDSALIMTHNKISALPANMSNLDHLNEINLSNNEFTELSAQIVLPKKLHELMLPFNKVASLPADMRGFFQLPSGHEFLLNLTENPIQTVEGVQKPINLQIPVGPQCAFEEDTYLFIGEGRSQAWIIRDGREIGERVQIGRTTPGPYERGRVNLLVDEGNDQSAEVDIGQFIQQAIEQRPELQNIYMFGPPQFRTVDFKN